MSNEMDQNVTAVDDETNTSIEAGALVMSPTCSEQANSELSCDISDSHLDKSETTTEKVPVLEKDTPEKTKHFAESKLDSPAMKSEIEDDEQASPEIQVHSEEESEKKRGTKRKTSIAFSNEAEPDFKGFPKPEPDDSSAVLGSILARIEASLLAAYQNFTPVRVFSTSRYTKSIVQPSKRPRKDTEGSSRPSSAMSSRSGEDTANPSGEIGGTPVGSRGRRPQVDLSSPSLRVPMERGWKRELVYRGTVDAHARRNADIYYYMPQGRKLRSMREISENLSGTGLTIENFTFCKEPLGLDDPEKEIIRDAKAIRHSDAPVPAPAPVIVEGKRTPKPKAPKGASPEPLLKSPPAKIKVKSVGSRLSGSGPGLLKQKKHSRTSAVTPDTPKTPATTDNNNIAWKKQRPEPQSTTATAETTAMTVAPPLSPKTVTPPPPPPLQSRPLLSDSSPDTPQGNRQVVQPCSMSCGRGTVPSLACAACLCLYHPICVGLIYPPAGEFLCKNCCSPKSPMSDPPPLTHKSGVFTAGGALSQTPIPRKTQRPEGKRVLLRMKVASGGPHGERIWAVAKPTSATTNTTTQTITNAREQSLSPPPPMAQTKPAPSRPIAMQSMLPQSVAVINVQTEEKWSRMKPVHSSDLRRGRIANGSTSPTSGSASLLAGSPRRRGRGKMDEADHFTVFHRRAANHNYNVTVQIFQYLSMRDLAHCARVSKLWRQIASTQALWRYVRMKNSHVSDWGNLCALLKKYQTKRLDLRKMLLPQNDTAFWEQFVQHIGTADTLERIDMCRCPASAVEAVCRTLKNLRVLSATAIRDPLFNPAPLEFVPLLHELRLKSMAGLSLASDLRPLRKLHELRHLSLTSIKELGWCACDVLSELPQLESLELGECTFRAEFGDVLSKLQNLQRLRLERGTAQCNAPALLRSLSTLPRLTRLELVNVDVKPGFDDALAECKNIERLLIIPTYVSQSATTNKQVLSGVLRLKDTLTHLMWGVTIELLRVTELFIDQCEQGAESKKKDIGECIPVLKPVPGCKLPVEHQHVQSPPQVEILPLPTLQRLLSAQLPNTKLKLLRIPFHATWRQSLADFQ